MAGDTALIGLVSNNESQFRAIEDLLHGASSFTAWFIDAASRKEGGSIADELTTALRAGSPDADFGLYKASEYSDRPDGKHRTLIYFAGNVATRGAAEEMRRETAERANVILEANESTHHLP